MQCNKIPGEKCRWHGSRFTVSRGKEMEKRQVLILDLNVGRHCEQGDQSPDTLKFPDNSLTMCGTHAHVKCYSKHACSTSFNIKFTIIS